MDDAQNPQASSDGRFAVGGYLGSRTHRSALGHGDRMPPSLVNRVAVRFALIAAFLIPATIFSCMSTTWLITIAAQVENCHEIIGCLKDLGTLLRDAETGQRGFLLTGNAEYLSPYDEATTLIERKLDTLAALARSD